MTWSRESLAESHQFYLDDFEAMKRAGHFAGKKIVLVDPDSPRRGRNVYEDLDQESSKEERKALITLYPEYAIAAAEGFVEGEPIDGLVETTHARAIRDMTRMIERFGYRIASIERDIY